VLRKVDKVSFRHSVLLVGKVERVTRLILVREQLISLM